MKVARSSWKGARAGPAVHAPGDVPARAKGRQGPWKQVRSRGPASWSTWPQLWWAQHHLKQPRAVSEVGSKLCLCPWC